MAHSPIPGSELLRRLLPREWADDAVGDLEEEWPGWVQEHGRAGALLRYGGRASSLLLHGARYRLARCRPGIHAAWPEVRRVARRPWAALVATLTLGPALAGTGTFVALSWGMGFEPLPYPEAERLVVVAHTAPGLGGPRQSVRLHEHYRARTRAAERMGLFRHAGANVVTPRGARRLPVVHVTPDALIVLGLGEPRPAASGVPEAPREPGRSAVLLTHEARARLFPGRASVEGVVLQVDGVPRTVQAVLDPGVTLPGPPADLVLVAEPDTAGSSLTTFTWSGSLARLAPGATPEELASELASLLLSAPSESGDGYNTVRGLLGDGIAPSVTRLRTWEARPLRPFVATGTLTSVLLLVLTSAAVATLLATPRGPSHERRIRRLLGAKPSHLRLQAAVRVSVTLGGAVVASILCALALDGALARTLSRLNLAAPAGPPAAGTAAALGLVTVAALSIRAWPRRDGSPDVPDGNGGSSQLRAWMLAAQMAVGVVLVSASVVLGQSAWRLSYAQLGYEPEDLVVFGVVLPDEPYGADSERALALHEALRTRLSGADPVRAATFGLGVPGAHAGWLNPFEIAGRARAPGSEPAHRFRVVAHDYLDVLGIPVRAGRSFTPADEHAPAATAIVNEAFASRYWPSPSAALGQRLRAVGERQWRTIVGVAGDTADEGPAEPRGPMIYLPLSARTAFPGSLTVIQHAVRGPAGVDVLEHEVRGALGRLDPSTPAFSFESGPDSVRRTSARERLAFQIVAIASLAGLLAAVFSLGGTVLFEIARRARTLALRKALGMGSVRLGWEVSRCVLVPTLVGLTIGGLAVAGGLSVPATLLHGVQGPPVLQVALGGVAILVLTVAVGMHRVRRRSVIADLAAD